VREKISPQWVEENQEGFPDEQSSKGAQESSRRSSP